MNTYVGISIVLLQTLVVACLIAVIVYQTQQVYGGNFGTALSNSVIVKCAFSALVLMFVAWLLSLIALFGFNQSSTETVSLYGFNISKQRAKTGLWTMSYILSFGAAVALFPAFFINGDSFPAGSNAYQILYVVALGVSAAVALVGLVYSLKTYLAKPNQKSIIENKTTGQTYVAASTMQKNAIVQDPAIVAPGDRVKIIDVDNVVVKPVVTETPVKIDREHCPAPNIQDLLSELHKCDEDPCETKEIFDYPARKVVHTSPNLKTFGW